MTPSQLKSIRSRLENSKRSSGEEPEYHDLIEHAEADIRDLLAEVERQAKAIDLHMLVLDDYKKVMDEAFNVSQSNCGGKQRMSPHDFKIILGQYIGLYKKQITSLEAKLAKCKAALGLAYDHNLDWDMMHMQHAKEKLQTWRGECFKVLAELEAE